MSFPKAPQQGRGGVGVEPRQVGPESGTKGPSGETSLSGLPLWPYVFLLCSSLLSAAVFPQFVCSYKGLLPPECCPSQNSRTHGTAQPRAGMH